MSLDHVDRILAPIDFSPLSLAALDCAAKLASALRASLTLMHTYEPPNGLSNIVPGAGAADLEQQLARATQDLDAVAQRLRLRYSLEVHTLLEPGVIVDTILKRARIGGFGLIVMGTRGRMGLERWMLGSVTEEVLRRASCPVLTLTENATHDAPG